MLLKTWCRSLSAKHMQQDGIGFGLSVVLHETRQNKKYSVIVSTLGSYSAKMFGIVSSFLGLYLMLGSRARVPFCSTALSMVLIIQLSLEGICQAGLLS